MFSTYCTFVNVLLRVSLCFAKPFIGWEPSILSPECAGNSVVAAAMMGLSMSSSLSRPAVLVWLSPGWERTHLAVVTCALSCSDDAAIFLHL